MRIPAVAVWLAIVISPAMLSGQTSNARCDSISFRFVDQSNPRTAPLHRSIQDGESYALRDSALVNGRGIAEIRVWAHRGGSDTTWDVLARLTPAGASAMTAATSRNIGHMMAALLGDTIVANAIIEAPLGASVPVRVGVTHKEADSVAARVRRVSGISCKGS